MTTSCLIDGCLKPSRRKGLCGMHYWRNANGRNMTAPPLRRHAHFDELFTVAESGCWEWTGAISSEGYGRYKKGLAHRYSYEVVNGPIPPGLHLDHLCRNRACCNPAHLEAVTPRINTLRGETLPAANAVKTECVNGHRFTPDNTAFTREGHRVCRICNRVASARYAAKARA